MLSHYSVKLCGHRHCGGGDMIFLVVEGQDSTCFHLNRHYCLSLKRMESPALTYPKF